MAQKRIKRTDQEWFELIKDCKTSSLKVKTWCEQHGITAKALAYHTRRLRQNGYTIPQKIAQTVPYEKHEIVCLNISQNLSGTKAAASALNPQAVPTMVLRLDFHGVQMDISNDAAQETITNTLLALQSLCSAIFPEYQSSVSLQIGRASCRERVSS